MQCQTVLAGTECTFWSKQGCAFIGNSCQPVIDDCQGCERIVNGTIGQVCSVAPSPKQKWSKGICNMATHRRVEIQSAESKSINPLKASKKASAKKK